MTVKNKKTRIRLIAVICLAAAMLCGIALEVYLHSDGYIRKRFSDLEESYTAVAQYAESTGFEGGQVAMTEIKDPDASFGDIEDYKDSGIYDELIELKNGGVTKITADSSAVWFYNDLNTGCCYVFDPEKAFENADNQDRLKGKFYKFNLNKK